MAPSTVFRKSTTNTYRRRSAYEREQVRKRREAALVERQAAERVLLAAQYHKEQQARQSTLSFQLCHRELTGNTRALRAYRPSTFGAIDSLLTLYDKKIRGPSLARLSVLMKGDRTVERDLLAGDLILLGYPRGNEHFPMNMLGYRLCESEEEGNMTTSWDSSWQKSVHLYFMRIHFQSVSYSVTPAHSQQPIIATKPVALLKVISQIRCCHVNHDIHTLCVHQSEDARLFFLFHGNKNGPVYQPPKRAPSSVLPNSLSAHQRTALPPYRLDPGLPDWSHYDRDPPVPLGTARVVIDAEDDEEEENGYLCILPSPLMPTGSQEPCASLQILFPTTSQTVAFDPRFIVYDDCQHSMWLLLNLKHSIYRIQVTYTPNDLYVPDASDEEQRHDDHLTFRYFTPHVEEEPGVLPASFIHVRAVHPLEVDRLLYRLIHTYYPHLHRQIMQLSSQALTKIDDTTVLLQLLFYAKGDKDASGGVVITRGGFLLSLDIVNGQQEPLHRIPTKEFTSNSLPETLHQWSSRVAHETRTRLRMPHDHMASESSRYTWDNSSHLSGTSVKFLPHPTVPFVLVNDLQHPSV